MEQIPIVAYVLAASFIQFTLDKFAQLKEVFGTGSGVAAMAVILIAYLKYRTAKALVVAGILGGLAAWLVNNVVWVQERVDEETNSMAPIERVVEFSHHDRERHIELGDTYRLAIPGLRGFLWAGPGCEGLIVL